MLTYHVRGDVLSDGSLSGVCVAMVLDIEKIFDVSNRRALTQVENHQLVGDQINQIIHKQCPVCPGP